MPPTSIDGTDITGATIDGTDVTEITVDGQTVFTAISAFLSDGFEDNKITSRDTQQQTPAETGLPIGSYFRPSYDTGESDAGGGGNFSFGAQNGKLFVEHDGSNNSAPDNHAQIKVANQTGIDDFINNLPKRLEFNGVNFTDNDVFGTRNIVSFGITNANVQGGGRSRLPFESDTICVIYSGSLQLRINNNTTTTSATWDTSSSTDFAFILSETGGSLTVQLELNGTVVATDSTNGVITSGYRPFISLRDDQDTGASERIDLENIIIKDPL